MPPSSLPNDIIVVDLGSQYARLIVRRLRGLGVAADLVSPHAPPASFQGARGIILSGGPDSAYEQEAATIPPALLSLGVPVLGICYGMQLMVQLLGGTVAASRKREYGPAELHVARQSRLFRGLPRTLKVWMSHGDRVTALPHGFVATAATSDAPYAAIEHPRSRYYGIQFHPEVEHTEHGTELFKRFALDICRCQQTDTTEHHIEEKIKAIREHVGDQRVICATSGGVDSSVVAALLGEAVGDQLTCIFVNSGTLRKGEGREAYQLLRHHLGLNVQYVNAQHQFLSKLEGVTYGERKRKIIGKAFISVFEETARSLKPRPTFLAQGTIQSDVVESASTATGHGATHLIKSHHNVGGLPARLKLDLIEPLRDLFKDEVREVGEALGLPRHAVWRQPFPGPGLAIRVTGEVTKSKLAILRKADAIVREEIEAAGLHQELYQYFAVLISEKTVGVTGDKRYYGYPILVRAVVSSDIMTSDWARIPPAVLARISERIPNEVRGTARVLYDITSKPPGTVEWE